MAEHELTEFERGVLAELDSAIAFTKEGSEGDWVRSFQSPGGVAKSRAMKKLTSLGLAEMRPGRGTGKLGGPTFRSLVPIPPDELERLNNREPWAF